MVVRIFTRCRRIFKDAYNVKNKETLHRLLYIHGPEKWNHGVVCIWIMHILLEWDKNILRSNRFEGSYFPEAANQKIPASDNAPEFCDEDLNLRWEKIECKSYKTPVYNPSIEWIGGEMVETVKIGLKVCPQQQQKKKNRSFLPRLLLSCHTIPHA